MVRRRPLPRPCHTRVTCAPRPSHTDHPDRSRELTTARPVWAPTTWLTHTHTAPNQPTVRSHRTTVSSLRSIYGTRVPHTASTLNATQHSRARRARQTEVMLYPGTELKVCVPTWIGASGGAAHTKKSQKNRKKSQKICWARSIPNMPRGARSKTFSVDHVTDEKGSLFPICRAFPICK